MYCKNCGQQMNDNQAICLQCGVAVGVGERFCANCGQPVEAGADVCLSCGVAINKPSTYLNGQDKVAMALLALFIGGLGIHNFIMGENKKGLLRLILSVLGCGIGGIFGFVDFILILTGGYTVKPDAYFF